MEIQTKVLPLGETGGLYSIISKEITDDGGVFHLHLNPECIIYKAHFPEQPITPGVCITQIAVELAEIVVGHSLQMIGIKNVKFLSIMTPDSLMEVTYSITIKSSDDKETRIQAVAQSDDVVYAKMSLICKR
jgi:3-hydroxyacyl-[acyl-carrier-protein] dehydratase